LKEHSSTVAYVRAERILRRLDGDNDGKLNYDDWINNLIPEHQNPTTFSKQASPN
jgi:Ca2+-binding EF-hand superfamily protein